MTPAGSGVLLALLCVLASLGLAAAALATVLLVQSLLIRPWDSCGDRDQLAAPLGAPLPVFNLVSRLRHALLLLADVIPGPMRAVEVSAAFMKSQALFALVNLGVPDVLASGPKTAQELAAATGCANAEWLERVLDAAVAYRLLRRRPAAAGAGAAQPAACALPSVGGVSCAGDDACPAAAGPDQQPERGQGAGPAARVRPGTTSLDQQPECGQGSQKDRQNLSEFSGRHEYYANDLTACLRSDHASKAAAMVKLNQMNCNVACHLTQGLVTGVTPQLLAHGVPFWQGLVGDPVKGAVFDQAMHSEKHCMAGVTVTSSYNWASVDTVVDVGGGTGGFMALLLQRHPHLQGVVIDQKEQVQRGHALWAAQHRHLLPRVSFAQGDMFVGSTLPRPPALGTTVYLLHSILHNWPARSALDILRAIRAAIGDGGAPEGRVRLLVVELTSSRVLQPSLWEARTTCDLVMLCNFGGGREREEGQFQALLGGAGFRLRRTCLTKGLFVVLEAEPV